MKRLTDYQRSVLLNHRSYSERSELRYNPAAEAKANYALASMGLLKEVTFIYNTHWVLTAKGRHLANFFYLARAVEEGKRELSQNVKQLKEARRKVLRVCR